ncbi:MAG TPA: hypothetical protein VJL84_12370 [Kiloniellales bacterium]|nr:hypothetical protein [Kiloniellales bacterium]
MEHRGSCHCGALRVSYRSAVPPGETEVRACQCSFCRRHGSRAISDPGGRVVIEAEARALNRYRFGLGTADYFLCARCGVYLAAVMTEGERAWSVVIVNALDDAESFARPPMPMVYDAEDEAARRARRRAKWTPTEVRVR